MLFGKTQKTVMAIVILILIFCGAMFLLCRMICGFTELLSNSKKKMR